VDLANTYTYSIINCVDRVFADVIPTLPGLSRQWCCVRGILLWRLSAGRGEISGWRGD